MFAAEAFDVTAAVPLRGALLRVGAGRARARDGAAPHRRRRLVLRAVGPRRHGRLHRAADRRGTAVVAAADPVRRLRAVAARVARRRNRSGVARRTPAGLLVAGTGRAAGPAGAARGPAAARGAVASWRSGAVRHRRRHPRGAGRSWPARTTCRCSCCCTVRSRCCWPVCRAPSTSRSAARWRAAATAHSTTSSGCSSTPWSSAPTVDPAWWLRHAARRDARAGPARVRARRRAVRATRRGARPGPVDVVAPADPGRVLVREPGAHHVRAARSSGRAGRDRRGDLAVRSAPDRGRASGAAGIEGHITFAADLFEPETVARFGDTACTRCCGRCSPIRRSRWVTSR